MGEEEPDDIIPDDRVILPETGNPVARVRTFESYLMSTFAGNQLQFLQPPSSFLGAIPR